MKVGSTKRLVKVWITKYALTQGVFEVEAEIVDGKYAKTVGAYPIFTTEWARTKQEARDAWSLARGKKIASLEKQIAKLKSMAFKVAKFK